jgi:AraC-like DNA-binding protein
MKSIFETRKPENQDLSPFIAYYYFHQSTKDSGAERFTYYPHVKNALTVYKDSKIEIKDSFTTSASPSSKGYTYNYTNLISHFAQAELNPPFDKIGIVFQPLGLNHFVKMNLSKLITQTFNLNLTPFSLHIQKTLDQVYSTESFTEKTALLDHYFQQIFTDFTDEKMKQAMGLVLAETADYTVQSLADQLEISRKTLLRMFNRHLNCSVKDYLRVIKFRKAVDHFQSSNKNSRLTDLAYDMDYNDQSEFIHHFKKLTGFSPKPFFKNLEPLSNQGTYWSKKK